MNWFNKTFPEIKLHHPEIRVYLDKNIIIDYLIETLLGKSKGQSARRIVEAVLGRKIDATVSTNCITSANSYIRMRLARPEDEGGMGLGDEKANIESEKAISALFYKPDSPWRFVDYGSAILRKGKTFETLSWEDGMEWSAFKQAQKWRIGPEYFVTRDRHFDEGVTPDTVLGWLEGKQKIMGW